MKRSTAAFTLIELLVVVTIIGILAGLAIPATSSAITAAKRAEAGAMVNQLRTALTAYETEYGRWPSVWTSESAVESSNTELFGILTGSASTVAAGQNPRRIAFMEFSTKVLRSGSISSTNTRGAANGDKFVDPWSQAYQLQVDFDYDNKIAVGDSQGDIPTTIAIWSRGNQRTYNATSDKSKYITSWK
jgi:prepilin-type N-terminal cleavage/methylation domain-containing protein